MAFEIERKFRVHSADWQRLVTGRARIRQAYLPAEAGLSLRVRVKNDDYATLTLKSRESQLRRLEFEYPIPTADAEAMMALRRGSVIEKVRHTIPWDGLMWEIDVFSGDNTGLVIAEIELRHEHQQFVPPRWLGEEVTGQPHFYNRALTQRPFCSWTEPHAAAAAEPTEATEATEA
jgi:adenylate cyclase